MNGHLIVRRNLASAMISALLLIALGVNSIMVLAQTAPVPNDELSDSITGVLRDSEGAPLAGVLIQLRSLTGPLRIEPEQTVETASDGTFRFLHVPPAPYSVTPMLWGYVQTGSIASSSSGVAGPGTHLTITVAKGGVITGKVMDASGTPQVSLPVQANRVRDENGRKLAFASYGSTAHTDDRGIFRIYGLHAGSYVVAVGPNVEHFGRYLGTSEIAYETPTFFPSSSAETATEVKVGLGQETGGIDVRLRSQRGHNISGTLAAVAGTEGETASSSNIFLRNASNGMDLGYREIRDPSRGFVLGDIPDGTYLVRGSRWTPKGSLGSPWVTVTVKGADVTGLQLPLTLNSSLAGHVQLASNDSSGGQCTPNRSPRGLVEMVLILRRVPNGDQDRFDRTRRLSPDSDGSFLEPDLGAGTYSVGMYYPDDSHYVRSVTRPGPEGKPVELLGAGLTIGSAEKVSDVVVDIAENGARLAGRLAPAKPGEQPPRSRVHLIPAEPTAADNVLRYRELTVKEDGTFAFTNLAPGRYLILAEVLSPDAAIESTRVPAFWDAAARAKLRRAAEKANIRVELKPCQQVESFVVRAETNLGR